jgi:hypothetical protein
MWTPSNVPTVTTVPSTVGGSPESVVEIASVIRRDHQKFSERRTRVSNVVERDSILHIELTTPHSSECREMRCTVSSAPQIARKRSNVCARSARDRYVDLSSAVCVNLPRTYLYFGRLELECFAAARRIVRANPIDRFGRVRRRHLLNFSGEIRDCCIDGISRGAAASRITVPVESSVSVSAPNRIVALYVFGSVVMNVASRVARPSSRTSKPVAKGSSVPRWPMLRSP